MNEKIRRTAFLLVSLFLSVIISAVVISIFTAVVYLGGIISNIQMILFLLILGVNVAISISSIFGLKRILPELISNIQGKKALVINYGERKAPEEVQMGEKIPGDLFSETELDIISLLKSNENRMLQSAIVSQINSSKASVSRTLTALENKGIIVKLRKGVTNEIILDETRFK
ncbi:MAG: MarR family transcriptional regulator [Candidatus Thermoplasmatota archaeon]|nr:MarR family transcriptional regulator [Candidatus Thermoplasmatota archaeon]